MTQFRRYNPSLWWRRSVVIMRIACPINLIFCVFAGTFAFFHHAAETAASDFYCAGITLVLGGINWFVFSLKPLGE